MLSAVITRIRGNGPAVPLVAAYDDHERVWLPPAPVLFQRRIGAENRAIPAATVRKLLTAALARTGLTDPSGAPLHYTLHDFRRMFLTDAKIGGVASDATFPWRCERPWPALCRWGPRREQARADGKVADDLRWHHVVASAHTMMHPDLLHPAAA